MTFSEDFKPFPNKTPNNKLAVVSFFVRRILDFQLLTIYRDIRPYLSQTKGTILDVGCGDCPYQHMVPSEAKYIGIDVNYASEFDYKPENNVITFDGTNIPFEANSMEHIICCEVLEHVSNPEPLIAEMHRVLKSGGSAFITIPWSARYHYIPYDYARYTPSKLKELFKDFTIDGITPRGSDIVAVCNKLIVIGARSVYNQKIKYHILVIMLLISPLWALVIAWGQASVWFKLGSPDDPLGYTIRIRKA